MGLTSKLYFGSLFHTRLRPVKHHLKYRVFSMLIDLDELEILDKNVRFFSINRFNLFSLHEGDHGGGEKPTKDMSIGNILRNYIDEIIKNMGVYDQVFKVKMLCYPRIFGYGFNPLTVYYCLDEDEKPLLMIYEVRNTFGEHCTYVLEAGKKQTSFYHQMCKKNFYVSPFNQVKGHYEFTHSEPEDRLVLRVDLFEDDQALIKTCFSGERQEFNSKNMLRAFFKYPMMSIKIIGGIHWEALKLWRKGLRLEARPQVAKRRLFLVKEQFGQGGEI